jgi:hypothetical protein
MSMTRRPDLTELRRLPTPDLRRAIDDRLGEPLSVRMHDAPTLQKRIIVLAMAVFVTGGTLFALARAFDRSAADRRTPGTSSLGPLTGDALAQRRGLIKHEMVPGSDFTMRGGQLMQDGEVMDGCTRTKPLTLIVKVEHGAFFYCVYAPTKLELWEITQRLRGHVPTQSEIDQVVADLRRDRATHNAAPVGGS